MELESLWINKESLRDRWREDKSELSGAQFVKAQDDWETAFKIILENNGIRLVKGATGKVSFFEKSNGLELSKHELRIKLEKILGRRLFEKISFDYNL